jgi:hypothetical protein
LITCATSGIGAGNTSGAAEVVVAGGILAAAGPPDGVGALELRGVIEGRGANDSTTGGGAVEYATRAESVSGIPGGASVTK